MDANEYKASLVTLVAAALIAVLAVLSASFSYIVLTYTSLAVAAAALLTFWVFRKRGVVISTEVDSTRQASWQALAKAGVYFFFAIFAAYAAVAWVVGITTHVKLSVVIILIAAYLLMAAITIAIKVQEETEPT